MLFRYPQLAALAAVLGTSFATMPATFRYSHLGRSNNIKDAYDYVIVGAGTAGLTIADRLTESGKYSVLVIEYCHLISDATIKAGRGRSFPDPGIEYNISSIPQPGMGGRSQKVWIGCCVGGSSAINGMVMVRGTKSEYNGWAELGGHGSTWNWEGILPYFKKAIHFNPPEDEVAKNFNITWDPNAWSWGNNSNSRIYASFPNYEDPGTLPMYRTMAKMPGMEVPLDGAGGDNGLFWYPSSMDNIKYWRSYARTGHYDNITRDNYEVVTQHRARKVIFDGTKAVGVEFFKRGSTNRTMVVKARKEVILSAGTVHTPQILQLSGIGPKDLLRQANITTLLDLPGVGQNFQDHAYLSVGYRWSNGAPPEPNITQAGNPMSIAGPNLGAWIGLPTISEDWEKIAAKYEAQDPAAYLPNNTHPTVVAGYAAFKKLHVKLLRSKNANFLWMPISSGPGGIVMSMHIASHGTININPANPEAEPIVDYRALSNPIDMDIIIANIKFMRKYMNSTDFQPCGPVETFPGTDVTGEELEAWVKQQIVPTNFHPIATAAKKPKEMGGVVDEDLLVHGTQNLRVVDGSIMPMLPGANTQQTVYMLAEKAVDLIKTRW